MAQVILLVQEAKESHQKYDKNRYRMALPIFMAFIKSTKSWVLILPYCLCFLTCEVDDCQCEQKLNPAKVSRTTVELDITQINVKHKENEKKKKKAQLFT